MEVKGQLFLNIFQGELRSFHPSDIPTVEITNISKINNKLCA